MRSHIVPSDARDGFSRSYVRVIERGIYFIGDNAATLTMLAHARFNSAFSLLL